MNDSGISLVLAVISLLVSSYLAIYSSRQSKILQSYAHSEQENIKRELSFMSAALRSIVVKSTLVPHLGSVDFATERETIRRFLATPAFMLIEYDLAKNNIESALRISLIIISESSSL